MKIHRQNDNFEIQKAVLTMGAFDGLHRGHHSIIGKLIDTAKRLGGQSVVMTFWPHPRMVLQSDDADLQLLNSLDERIELLRKTGIDHLIVYPFSVELAQLTAEQFIEHVLVGNLGIVHLVLGFNHAFGRNREGNFAKLQQYASNFGFGIDKQRALTIDADSISSTKIRGALQQGDIDRANKYLGYNYSLIGEVIHGRKVGRSLGYATANLRVLPYKLIPQQAVYAVIVEWQGRQFAAMLNIGKRPTFDADKPQISIEIHILGFDADIYGHELRLEFVQRLRSEQAFGSVDELVAQLACDKRKTAKILAKYL